MPEDTPGEEQRTMLTFTEAAERLVKDKIAQSMTAEGLRRLARDPASGWPIGPGDYRVVGKARMLPYELLAPYMRERYGKRRGRGPDAKKRGSKPIPQGDPMPAQDQATAAPVLQDELLQRLYRSYGAKDVHTMSAAQKLLDAYRAAELRDFLWRLGQSSGDSVAAKLVEDNPDLAELLNATETEAQSDG